MFVISTLFSTFPGSDIMMEEFYELNLSKPLATEKIEKTWSYTCIIIFFPDMYKQGTRIPQY